MFNFKIPVFFILVCFVFSPGCEKENDNDRDDQSGGYINSFISLTAEKDTLLPGGSTKITAVVDGVGVKYIWIASQGDILGFGSKITYVAPTCACGKSEVFCKAKAGSMEILKSVIITIAE